MPCSFEYHTQNRYRVYDAGSGRFLTFVCDKCQKEKLSRYRTDIFQDASYCADEPIEEQDQ